MSARVLPFPADGVQGKPRRRRARVTRRTEEARVFERGLWYAPFLVNGREVVIAVSSTGERLAELTVTKERNSLMCQMALQALLDVLEPETSKAALELVRGGLL